jgi:hypothetical protein
LYYTFKTLIKESDVRVNNAQVLSKSKPMGKNMAIIYSHYGKFLLCTLLWLLINNSFAYAQFKITDDATIAFAIDPFTNEVYYQEYFYHFQRKVSIPDLTISDSPLSGLPCFSEKVHRAYYWNNFQLFMYDYDSQTTCKLWSSDGLNKQNDYNRSGLLASPNDINILFDPTMYYSFEDSSHHVIDTYVWIDNARWSSDSTIIFNDGVGELLEVNIYSQKVDTILVLPTKHDHIISFDYDINSRIVAYSERIEPALHIFNRNTMHDTIVFSLKDLEYYDGRLINFTSIQFSRAKNKIAFLLYYDIDPLAGIYYYDLDSSKIFPVTNCDFPPTKEILLWFNADTLIYDGYDYDREVFYLFGIPLRKTTSVDDDLINEFSSEILGNYPNPFNSQTIIRFNLEKPQSAEIYIYNVLGEEIYYENLGYLPGGMNEYKLKLNNEAAGTYIYRILLENRNLSGKVTYLK